MRAFFFIILFFFRHHTSSKKLSCSHHSQFSLDEADMPEKSPDPNPIQTHGMTWNIDRKKNLIFKLHISVAFGGKRNQIPEERFQNWWRVFQEDKQINKHVSGKTCLIIKYWTLHSYA